MQPLISLEKLTFSYGNTPLLDEANFTIQPGERVCLIGRNGMGKSSFLKVVDGTLKPDAGQIHREPGLNMRRLEQELPEEGNLTVYETVAQAFDQTSHEAWESEQAIQSILLVMNLDGTQRVNDLSGGWKRRVALAKALVTKPQLLLLDEPTNHLDIEAIQWLEDQLLLFRGGLLFITHDRSLLQRLATRIIELDRGKLTSWPGDYDNFLRRKEEMLAAEATLDKEFDKKLAQEERWIRQGIKARRTRNEGRVRALEAMREERKQRREVLGKATLELNHAQRSGQLVAEAQRVTHYFGNQTIIKDFSIRIMQGDRIGLLGPNGVGKTTLLNILLGKLAPEQGEVRLGTKLEVAYFDQLRSHLDPEASILDTVSQGRSSITINGKDRHIVGYLGDFLFPPNSLRMPVKVLSGGECNRLMLAKLFSTPANVLVMDEPTNDLDIETLELLEDLLAQFSGTLLLVSHDRSFFDNIVTRTLAFEGNGHIGEYIGGYQDWLAQRPVIASPKTIEPAKPPKQNTLDLKERKELSALIAKAEKLEQQQQQLFIQMAQPGFYEQPANSIENITEQVKKIQQELEQTYARWEILETKLNPCQ